MSIHQSIKLTMLTFVSAWFLVGCGTNKPTFQVTSSTLQVAEGTSTATVIEPIANTFIDPVRFRDTERMAPWKYDGYPIAGVVNHHTAAMDLQAKFFKTLKSVRPDIKTFIILSPDHFRRGSGIATGQLPYATPSGLVSLNLQLLTNSSVDHGSFKEEHGVGALAPFIAREFPGAKIVPFFLRSDAPRDQLVALGDELAHISSTSTFVIVSSDMSHGLTDMEARKHDNETLSWMASNNWKELEKATDANTDSGPAFIVLHEYLSKSENPPAPLSQGGSSGTKNPLVKGGNEGGFDLLFHALSTDYGSDPKNATSYIVGFWK